MVSTTSDINPNTNFNEIFNNPTQYATMYSEELNSLKRLLSICFNNKIRTLACCRGTQGKGDSHSPHAYIYMVFNRFGSEYDKMVQIINSVTKIPELNVYCELRSNVTYRDLASKKKLEYPNCGDCFGLLITVEPKYANLLFNHLCEIVERKELSANKIINGFRTLSFLNKKYFLENSTKLIYDNSNIYLKLNEDCICNFDNPYMINELNENNIYDLNRGLFLINDDNFVNEDMKKVLKKI